MLVRAVAMHMNTGTVETYHVQYVYKFLMLKFFSKCGKRKEGDQRVRPKYAKDPQRVASNARRGQYIFTWEK